LYGNALAATLRSEIFNAMTRLTSLLIPSFALAAYSPHEGHGSSGCVGHAHSVIVSIQASALREVHNLLIKNLFNV
jgi:hypothetical protein